jgi:ribosomal protein S18 acetylase RimI-like enzyme
MAEITLRRATKGDYQFLYELHLQSLREYIEQTWGWDEDWQADYFWRKFDISDKRIVQYEGEDIGCLEVEDRGDQIFLSYIAIAPEFQGKGIGTRLIEAVLMQGRTREVPVALKVLKANPAWKLYERLGFTVTATSETHYWMIAHPQPTSGQ